MIFRTSPLHVDSSDLKLQTSASRIKQCNNQNSKISSLKMQSVLIDSAFLLILITLTQTLNFHFTGYEHCVFHLIVRYSGKQEASMDLMDQILQKNQGSQHWTVSSFSTPNINFFRPSLGTPLKFKERCSVNMIIHPEGCVEWYLFPIFGTRLQDANNMFILILGTKADCLEKSNFGFGIHPDIFALYLAQAGNKVENGDLFCPTCTSQYRNHRTIKLPQNVLKSLSKMAEFSTLIRSKSVEPTVLTSGNWAHTHSWNDVKPCAFMYKRRKQSRPLDLGCVPVKILLENAAAHLNSSLLFSKINTRVLFKAHVFREPGPHYKALAMMQLFEYTYDIVISVPKMFSQNVEDDPSPGLKGVYCVRKDEREAFNYTFWVRPFERYSWLLIGTSFLVISLLLRRDWFQVVIILMRQSCSILERRRILVVFVFVTIVLTYGYEGVISSLIIVRSPPIVHQSIGDLFLKGYRYMINYPFEQFYPPDWVKDIMRIHNLTRSQIAAEIRDDSFSSFLEAFRMCNFTFCYDNTRAAYVSTYLTHMLAKEGVHCHATRKSIPNPTPIDMFGGPAQVELEAFHRKFIESGILRMYFKFARENVDARVSEMRSYETFAYLDLLPVPFQLRDGKIMSTFHVLGAFLGLAFLVFSSELIYSWLNRSQIRPYSTGLGRRS